ncbi:MAG: type I secretion C-terminal target domain-containing protein, partial [Halioglobus sp.]
ANDAPAAITIEEDSLTYDIAIAGLGIDLGADKVFVADEEQTIAELIEINNGGLTGATAAVSNDGINIVVTRGALDVAVSGSFTYSVTDADGDTITRTVGVSADIDTKPTAGSGVAAVDDDGLADGNPISDVNDLNADTLDSGAGLGDEAVFVGNLAGFSAPGDLPVNVDLTSNTLASDTLGTETITYDWTGNVLTASSAERGDIFTVEFTTDGDGATGEYTVTLLQNVLHADEIPSDENASDPTVTLSITARDNDGSEDTTGSLTITFDDDAPIAFDPSNAVLENVALRIDTGVALDLDIDVDNNVGADQPGVLTFEAYRPGEDGYGRQATGVNEDDQQRDLMVNGVLVKLYASASGTVLYGATAAPIIAGDEPVEVVFTVTLKQTDGEDTYDFLLNQKIDPELTPFSVDDGYVIEVSGGNQSYNFFNSPDDTVPDILVAPLSVAVTRNDDGVVISVNTELTGTVNLNAFQFGTNQGPRVPGGEGIRVNYAQGVSGTPESGKDYAAAATNQDHVIGEHVGVNGAAATLIVKSGTTAVRVTAFQEDATDAPTNDVELIKTTDNTPGANVVSIIVSYGLNQFVFTSNDDPAQDGVDVVFNGDGTADVLGIPVAANGVEIAVLADTNYNAVEYAHLGDPDHNGEFSIGDFGGVTPGEERFVSINPLELLLTDSDQDTVSGTPLSIDLYPEPTTVLDAGRNGLVGSSGDDIFVFELADTSSTYTVNSFDVLENDALDLRDILNGETEASIDSFLQVSEVSGSTVINVSRAGSLTGNLENDKLDGLVDHEITLDGVSNLDLDSGLDGIIQDMINAGKLIVDN